MATTLQNIRPAAFSDIDFIISQEQRSDYAAYIHRWSKEDHKSNLDDPDKCYLIGVNQHDQPIAFTILAGLLSPEQSIELVRMAVVEPGQGIGGVLLDWVVEHVFGELKANRLWLDVFEENTRARCTYAKAGFRKEGVLREAVLKSTGELGSLVIMSILAKEYPLCMSLRKNIRIFRGAKRSG